MLELVFNLLWGRNTFAEAMWPHGFRDAPTWLLTRTRSDMCRPIRRPKYSTVSKVSRTLASTSQVALPGRPLVLLPVCSICFSYSHVDATWSIVPFTDKASVVHPLQPLDGNALHLHFFLVSLMRSFNRFASRWDGNRATVLHAVKSGVTKPRAHRMQILPAIVSIFAPCEYKRHNWVGCKVIPEQRILCQCVRLLYITICLKTAPRHSWYSTSDGAKTHLHQLIHPRTQTHGQWECVCVCVSTAHFLFHLPFCSLL